MNQPEYRFRSLEDFSWEGVSRVAEYYRRAEADEHQPPRSIPLAPGAVCEHVIQHLEPCADGDFSQRHGPYAFWLYGKADEDTQVKALVRSNDAATADIAASQELRWHRLGEMDLIGRMPSLKIENLGRATLACQMLLFTNDLKLAPTGDVDDVERGIYGFCRRDLGRSVLSPDVMTVFQEYEACVVYECGARPLVAGDRLILRHWGRYGSSLQNTDPEGEYYLEWQFPDATRWDVNLSDGGHNAGSRESWIECVLRDGTMSAGETARFTVRRFKPDVVRDCPFFRNTADHWYTPLSPLTFLVAPAGADRPVALHEANSHRFKVVNDQPVGLHAAAMRVAGEHRQYRIRG